ncbi:MAG: phospholipase D-like domain-containing protein [Cytophagaceae bacterium]
MANFSGEFLFDNQLISEIELLIKNSKNHLLLVSPFIDLDKRIEDALRQKKDQHDFELLILFGKNEDNYYKSIKRNSLDFLKDFPNVEIRYNERLHAKFYQNDFDFIMTSMNLYDYSLANNIEVGFKCNYASKGLIGKALNTADNLLDKGFQTVKEEVLGHDCDEVDPIEKFRQIFDDAVIKYKTKPKVKNKEGIAGIFGAKELESYEVKVNNFTNDLDDNVSKEEAIKIKLEITSQKEVKVVSASQLSKTLGIPQSEVVSLMTKYGLINGDKITDKGQLKGLMIKTYMGREYIAYPDNLLELVELKK